MMENKKVLLCLCSVICVFAQDVAKVTDVTNDDRLKYEKVDSDVFSVYPDEARFTNSSLEWLLNLYNPHLFGTSLNANVGPLCRHEMNEYITALQQGKSWAAKMTDASGRYSSQFFFGNSFWLGSYWLCHELGNPKSNIVLVLPPFKIEFRVAKLIVNLGTLTPRDRLVYLGLCLPKSCKNDEISQIVTSRSSHTINVQNATLKVFNVRTVPGSYTVWEDFKFYILLIVAVIISVLVFSATVYEYFMEYRSRVKERHEVNDKEGQTQISTISKYLSNANNNNDEKPKRKTSTHTYQISKPEARTTDTKMQIGDKDSKKTGVFLEFLLSFSALSNTRKIFDVWSTNTDDALTSIHGLRFLSLAWVILVHTYLQVFSIAENKSLRTVTERNFMYQTISNATYSVDTFFFISGLLLSYVYFMKEKKITESGRQRDVNSKTITVNFMRLMFYRFIRLTPVYLYVLGMVEVSMRFIHNRSVFEPPILENLNCEQYWWRNALYINSLFPRKEMCMLWSWYMANDTQFYTIGIILLLISVRYFKFSAATLLVILVSSWFTTAFISYTNRYLARIEEPFAAFDELYDKPWTRIGPHFVGIITGWILVKTDSKIRIPLVLVAVGWLLSVANVLALVYGLVGGHLGIGASAVYVSLGHTAWAMSLAWIVIACRAGYGGVINTLLSYRGLHPFSRLTYCAYLVHPMIMLVTTMAMDGPLHIHNGIIIIVFFGNMMASFLLSYLLSVCFESPVVKLLKILMTPSKKTR